MRYLVTIALAVALALVWWMSRWSAPGITHQQATTTAPTRGTRPPELPDMPRIDREAARDAYTEAQSRGSREPGMAAFRDHTSRFLAHNVELVGEHSRHERLTIAEIWRLTHFAMVVARMQDWSAVASVLGAPVPRAAQRQFAGDVRGASDDMKHRLRDHVAANDAEPVRSATIDEIEQDMYARYFELTGMDRAKLDVLLANALFGDPLAIAEAEPEPEPASPSLDGDIGEVAEVDQQALPAHRMFRIDRVRPPTAGAALAELEAAAARDPRLAAELAAERRR